MLSLRSRVPLVVFVCTFSLISRAHAERVSTDLVVASWSFNQSPDSIKVWDDLSVDVIALRDIDAPEQIAKVFPASRYNIHTSSPKYRLRTGFAVRKTLPHAGFDDVASLGIEASEAPDLTPAADIAVQWSGLTIRLLSVQLYPGCTERTLYQTGKNCSLLRKQAASIAGWVATRTTLLGDFMIVGDFRRVLNDNDGVWRIISIGESAKLHRVPIKLVWRCKEGWSAWQTEYVVLANPTLRRVRWLNQDPPLWLEASKCPQMLSLSSEKFSKH